MFSECVNAIPRSIKCKNDAGVSTATVTVDAESYGPFLAYGLPHGVEVTEAILKGEMISSVIPMDGQKLTITFTHPKSEEIHIIEKLFIRSATVKGKPNKESGDIDLSLKLVLEYEWSSQWNLEQTIFLLASMGERVTLKASAVTDE
jgi:hypothetical protein